MDPNLYYNSVAEVMVQAVNAVNTKISAGFYNGLSQTIPKVWPGLHNWPKKKWNAKNEQQGYHSDTEENPSGRTDGMVHRKRTYLNHVREHYQRAIEKIISMFCLDIIWSRHERRKMI